MKKFFTISILAMAMMFSLNANAQFHFGVKGGLNVTSMSFNKEVFDASNRAGFFIGPTCKFTLPIIGLGMDISALYDQKSSKVNDQTIRQKSINVPVNVRYNIGLGSVLGIYFAAGPQFGFNVGDADFSWTDSQSYKNTFQLKKSNLSVNLGAGVTLNKLEIGLAYNIGCGKTGDATYENVVSSVSHDIQKGKTNTNAWQISAAWFF